MDLKQDSPSLDDAPFGPLHRKILVGSGLGWALDAMDVGLISFIIAALAKEWHLSSGQAGLIASVGFAGMALGASLGGLLADRLGRRQVFALTLLVFGVATGASALVTSVGALLVLRFVVGLGLGSELPVASTYVMECSPSRIRGRVIVFLEAFWALGWTASAVIGTFVVPHQWRWGFVVGAIPAVYALVVRWGLPESPRWLLGRGRVEEAQAVARRLGGRIEVQQDTRPVRHVWEKEFRVRTVSLWTVWLCVNFAYYGAFIWIPSILVAAGFGMVKSFGFTLVMTLAQLPGYAVAGWLIERWGRRWTLSVFLVGSAVSAIAFGTMHSAVGIVAAGMLLSFFNLGAWGALYAVTPEVYPTSVRATGAGWAAGFGRLASIAAPLCVPLLLPHGVALTFAVFSGCFLVAAAAVWGVVERKGQPL